jgi:nucleotide-binding universal stress UspA family protein
VRLLIGIDGTDGGRDALELARTLASEGEGSSALLVTVVATGPLPMEYALLDDEEAAEAGPIFEEAREILGDVPLESRAFGGGSPAGILTELAEKEKVDAIVVGSPHRGALGRVLMGSVSTSLLNGAPCDVFVAPEGYSREEHYSFRTIAVGYDGAPESEAALRRAEVIARLSNANLKILTVVSPPVAVAVPGGYAPSSPAEPDLVIEGALDSIEGSLGAQGVRLDGSPPQQISKSCEEGVDLLVLGSRGYGPLARVLLGSVSRRVIHQAPCPVLVVPRP